MNTLTIIVKAIGGVALVAGMIWVCWRIVRESDTVSRERRHKQDRQWPRLPPRGDA